MTKIIKQQILKFQDKVLETIQKDNQIWVTSKSLSQALGYSREDAVSKIYNQNQDEFTSKMAMTAKLGVIGTNLKKDNIIFSLRGCHLIAMLSRTSTAKEFRKWVLDILDEEISSITPTDIVLPSLIDAKPFRIKFNNQNIMLIQNPETSEIFFNINKICNNLGINSNTQRHRIRKERILNENICKAKGLLNQISFYLPLKFLNEFLDGVYISRNNIHYKEQFQLLNLYQEECYNFLSSKFKSNMNNKISASDINEIRTINIDNIIAEVQNQIKPLNVNHTNHSSLNIKKDGKSLLQKREYIIGVLSYFISINEIYEIFESYNHNYNYILDNIYIIMNSLRHCFNLEKHIKQLDIAYNLKKKKK